MLVAANGFFVAAEFALVRARGSKVDEMAEEGKKGARLAAHQIDHIDEYLSACQLGITMASLGIGFMGEPAIASLIEKLLGESVPHGVSLAVSFGFAYFVTTALHITVGEQVPKIFAITHAESTVLRTARLLEVFRVALQAADLAAEHRLERDAAGDRHQPQGGVRRGLLVRGPEAADRPEPDGRQARSGRGGHALRASSTCTSRRRARS